MSMLDVFAADPAFTVTSLTDEINRAPYQPGLLESMGIFQTEGITTTTATVEEQDGVLGLIQTTARGAPAPVAGRGRRNVRAFLVPHLQLEDQILASDIQDVRAFGSEGGLEGIAQVVSKKLTEMRQSHEVTKEYHRIRAMQGIILDADGTPILDIFTAFAQVQISIALDLDQADEDIRVNVTGAMRQGEAALGAAVHQGYQVLCSPTFFDALISHPDVKAAYSRWQDGAWLRDDVRRGFPFPNNVRWQEYDATVSGQPFINANHAIMFPVGVPGLFRTYYAPGDFVEAANTVGIPYYAKQERMRFDRGIEIHTQSNPLSLVTRPRAVLDLTIN